MRLHGGDDDDEMSGSAVVGALESLRG
eukprot:COSAG06_NODE_40187_length_404_cov_0.990164_2_plen_26_part_01